MYSKVLPIHERGMGTAPRPFFCDARYLYLKGVPKGWPWECQAAEHEMSHGYMDPGLGGGRQGFIVLAQPPAPFQPSQRPLHHPSPRQHLKVMAVLGTLHDLHHPAGPGHDPINQLPSVAPVSPDQLQAWKSSGQLGDHQFRPSRSWTLAGCTTTANSIPMVSTPWFLPQCASFFRRPSYRRHSREAPFFRGLHALVVDDRRAGNGTSACGLPDHGPQCLVDSFPSPIPGPLAEVFVQRLPMRQVVGDHPPRATGAQQVQDTVDHLPQIHRAGPSSRPGWRECRKEEVPLFISQVAGI